MNLSTNTMVGKTTHDFASMIQIIFWNSMGFLFYMYILAYITAEYFAVNGKLIGVIIAALPFGRMFVTPLVGWLTDRVSKKKLILIGSFGRALSYITYYFSIIYNSVIGFATGVFLQGVLVGFFWPPLNTLIAEKSSVNFRSEAYGKRSGMIGYGSLAGAVISFLIFNGIDFVGNGNLWIKYSPFILFAIGNFYAGVKFYHDVDEKLIFQESHEPIKLQTNNNKTSAKIYKNGFLIGIIAISIASMTASMNDHIARPFIQLFMGERFFFTDIIIMLIMYSVQIIALLLAPKLGKLADRIHPLWGICVVSFIGAMLTGVIISIQNSILFIILLILDFTLGIAGTLLSQNIFSRVSIRHRGKMFGLVEWMALIGWIIGPICGGILWDHVGIQAPFILTIGLELMLIPLFIIGVKRLSTHFAEQIEQKET